MRAQGNSLRRLKDTIAVIQRELYEAAQSANSSQDAYDRLTSGPLVSDVYVRFTLCNEYVVHRFVRDCCGYLCSCHHDQPLDNETR